MPKVVKVIRSEKIPTGEFCYGFVPAHNSGFCSIAVLEDYLATLPLEKKLSEEKRLTRRVCCPYWKVISHGRVCCKLLGLVATCWNRRDEYYAAVFYRKHPKARERDKGCMIGDAIKECDINREGISFSFLSDPRQVRVIAEEREAHEAYLRLKQSSATLGNGVEQGRV